MYTLSTMVMATVSVRLEGDLAERLDKLAAKAAARVPGSKFSRSDIVRMAVEQGVKVLEKQLKVAAPRAKER
jgi:predicted transcriptional regulator